MTKEDYKLGHHKENKTWQTPADLLTKKDKNANTCTQP
jgi:hypothetical protein